MLRSPIRSCLVAVIAVAALVAPAAADENLAGSTFRVDIQVPDGDDGFRDPVGDEVDEFFNLANCVCGTEFAVELHLPNGDTAVDETGEVWVGTDCGNGSEDMTTRLENCELVPGGTYDDVVEALRSERTLPINSASLMWPNALDCSFDKLQRGVYMLVDDNNANDDVFLAEKATTVTIDTQPPPEPDAVQMSAGESSLVVTWDLPNERADDIEHVQFLCARTTPDADATEPFGEIDAEYSTAGNVCGEDDGVVPLDFAIGAPDALRNLDPATICGSASGTEASERIEGLVNEVEYYVIMLAIDKAGNATAIDLGTGVPKPVRDFWEDYKEKGGSAEGGICLIASTYGDDHFITEAMRDFRDDTLAPSTGGRLLIDAYYAVAMPLGAAIADYPLLRPFAQIALLPVIALAAFWHYLGLPGLVLLLVGLWWRRQRRRHGAGRSLLPATATGIALLLLAGPALAQQDYDPYWETWNAGDEPVGRAEPQWNTELKIGPYLPNIDDDDFTLGANEQPPFEETFRGKGMLLWAIELQRFFLYPEGQLGITGSLGFMGRSTNAFAVDDNGDVIRDADGNAERATDNKTRFRMVPVSVGGVYRFTSLDDKVGIPLVPYGKLGLSYYLWWVRDPNGNIARAQKDPTCDPAAGDCATTRALGASIGWQGSLGLAIRAERLDPDAAISLRNDMGVEHAGFFFELLYAQVDHFGADDRLKVGDFTWQAGLSFEF